MGFIAHRQYAGRSDRQLRYMASFELCPFVLTLTLIPSVHVPSGEFLKRKGTIAAGNRSAGSVRVLYSPSLSERGVLLCAHRKPRAADPFDFQV